MEKKKILIGKIFSIEYFCVMKTLLIYLTFFIPLTVFSQEVRNNINFKTNLATPFSLFVEHPYKKDMTLQWGIQHFESGSGSGFLNGKNIKFLADLQLRNYFKKSRNEKIRLYYGAYLGYKFNEEYNHYYGRLFTIDYYSMCSKITGGGLAGLSWTKNYFIVDLYAGAGGAIPLKSVDMEYIYLSSRIGICLGFILK